MSRRHVLRIGAQSVRPRAAAASAGSRRRRRSCRRRAGGPRGVGARADRRAMPRRAPIRNAELGDDLAMTSRSDVLRVDSARESGRECSLVLASAPLRRVRGVRVGEPAVVGDRAQLASASLRTARGRPDGRGAARPSRPGRLRRGRCSPRACRSAPRFLLRCRVREQRAHPSCAWLGRMRHELVAAGAIERAVRRRQPSSGTSATLLM